MTTPEPATPPLPGNSPSLVILGVPLHHATFDSAVAWIAARVLSGRPGIVATVNLDFLMQSWRDPELQRILLEADLVLADGQPVVWLSRLLGPTLPQRVTGSDLVPKLAANGPLRLFLLGGGPGVAEKAGAVLCAKNPALTIVGAFSPPPAKLLDMDHAGLLRQFDAAKAQVLLVAFGAPKQEKFINLHRRNWSIPVAIGVGGTLDFLAGVQVRAPRWVQKLALEWAWRLALAPKRLAQRYGLNLIFLAGALSGLAAARLRPAGRRPVAADAPEWSLLPSLKARHVVLPPIGSVATAAKVVAEWQEKPAHLIIDLGQHAWLGSLALGVLVEAAHRLRDMGHHVLLVGVGKRVEKLLRLYRLDRYLPIAVTADQAVRILRERLSDLAAGHVAIDPLGAMVVELPQEFNSRSVAKVMARIEEAWGAKVPAGVVVDAAAVTYVDSSGLGALVGLDRRARTAGIPFRCFGWRDHAMTTVRISGLAPLLLPAEAR